MRRRTIRKEAEVGEEMVVDAISDLAAAAVVIVTSEVDLAVVEIVTGIAVVAGKIVALEVEESVTGVEVIETREEAEGRKSDAAVLARMMTELARMMTEQLRLQQAALLGAAAFWSCLGALSADAAVIPSPRLRHQRADPHL